MKFISVVKFFLLLPAAVTANDCPWQQVGNSIDGEDTTEEDWGMGVALTPDGTTMAIGDMFDDSNGSNSGYARVFEFDGTNWNQKGNDLVGEEASDLFGRSVALSNDGKILAVGATRNDANGALNAAGHVRVFKWKEDHWKQRGNDIEGVATEDYLGVSISLSGDGKIMAVGTRFYDGHGLDSNTGRVQIYEYSSGTWTESSSIIGEGDDDGFGRSVSLSADATIMAVGARSNDGPNGVDSGHTRVFQKQGSSWIQIGGDFDGEGVDDFSGDSVSVSTDGNYVAMGAPKNDENGSNSGHTRVFQRSGTSFNQVGEDIDGENSDDLSGKSVSLSWDGGTVAIGSSGNAGSGSSSGQARVFRFDGTAWVQLGDSINGEDEQDQSGYSVALSADGETVVISGWISDGSSRYGHTRVFTFETCPTDAPTPHPTTSPTSSPTTSPTTSPTASPLSPTASPTSSPTASPTSSPLSPTASPTSSPTTSPTASPLSPTASPTTSPTTSPTASPLSPTASPTSSPTFAPVGSSGDPHFKMWSGQKYDFHGACDLVLLQNPGFGSGLGMNIHIRTEFVLQWSYISTAVLQIGDETLEVMAGKKNRYWINKEKNEDLGHGISGFRITFKQANSNSREVRVDLKDGSIILFKTFKDFLRVDVDGGHTNNFVSSHGLMGNVHGEKLARDHKTVINNSDAFGLEWQVLATEPMLFHNVESVQAPETCPLPTAATRPMRRRLGLSTITEEGAELACTRVGEEDRNSCIFDVMATNDKEMAGAY